MVDYQLPPYTSTGQNSESALRICGRARETIQRRLVQPRQAGREANPQKMGCPENRFRITVSIDGVGLIQWNVVLKESVNDIGCLSIGCAEYERVKKHMTVVNKCVVRDALVLSEILEREVRMEALNIDIHLSTVTTRM